jgi:3',5'-nucleoside bisphosphate phosphatase
MQIDLHCHTDCSDGNVSIEERIAMIRRAGFDAATITDHDFISVEQVHRAAQAAAPLPYIPAIELTTAADGSVVHLLGYFIDPANTALQNHINRVQALDREISGDRKSVV